MAEQLSKCWSLCLDEILLCSSSLEFLWRLQSLPPVRYVYSVSVYSVSAPGSLLQRWWIWFPSSPGTDEHSSFCRWNFYLTYHLHMLLKLPITLKSLLWRSYVLSQNSVIRNASLFRTLKIHTFEIFSCFLSIHPYIPRCQEQSLLLQLYHLQTNKCLVAQGRPSEKGGLVVLKACDYSDPNQVSDARDGVLQGTAHTHSWGWGRHEGFNLTFLL